MNSHPTKQVEHCLPSPTYVFRRDLQAKIATESDKALKDEFEHCPKPAKGQVSENHDGKVAGEQGNSS
jgi:hypothetical protein